MNERENQAASSSFYINCANACSASLLREPSSFLCRNADLIAQAALRTEHHPAVELSDDKHVCFNRDNLNL
jgi:hypothetical protein